MATNLPFNGRFKVTCEYGRKNSKTLKWSAGYHTGIDLVGVTSKTVYSTCDGTVIMAKNYGSYGNTVKIKDEEGRIHLFAHLKSISVKVGQKVTRTTVLGIMGATGNVTGVHLHYEIRTSADRYGKQYNPAEYMGIPNEVNDNLNSNDYQIKENQSKYFAGQIVEIQVAVQIAFTQGDKSIVDDGERQFWVHNSVISDNKIIARAKIAFAQENSYIVEVFSDQFWVDEENIIKEL